MPRKLAKPQPVTKRSDVEAIDWESLLSDLPPIIWRSRWNDLAGRFGLPYARGTSQNLDSKGLGPKKIFLGLRVGYKRSDLIEWLKSEHRRASHA